MVIGRTWRKKRPGPRAANETFGLNSQRSLVPLQYHLVVLGVPEGSFRLPAVLQNQRVGPESHSFSTGGCHVEPRTSRVFTMNCNIAWSEAKVGEPSPQRGAYCGAYSCPNGTISPESEPRMPTEVIESKAFQTGRTGRIRFSNPRVGGSNPSTPANHHVLCELGICQSAMVIGPLFRVSVRNVLNRL